jgi:hypothetical protein
MAKPTGPADTMEVGLRVLWEIKVDNNINSLDINATGEEVGADEITTDAIAEIVEDTVTVRLEHFGV